MEETIALIATTLLKTCTDDYASRIWSAIGDNVIIDVLQCTEDGIDGITEGDVALSIGRELASRLGVEDWPKNEKGENV